MARGHVEVIRRSLSLREWVKIRLKEVSHWTETLRVPLDGWEIRQADYTDPAHYRFIGRWKTIREGDPWGEPDGTFFFRRRVVVPREFRGMPVWFHLLTPSEMIFRISGRIVNALDPNREDIPLLKRARGGEGYDVEMEAYVRSAPDDQRIGPRLADGHGCVHTWRNPCLASWDPAIVEFLNDLQVPLDVADCTRVDEDVRNTLWTHIDGAIKLLDRDTSDRRTFLRSVEAARAYLKQHVYEAQGLGAQGSVALVGHSHLDVAYHWRVKQGIRKNARTTAVQLALMDEYPEFLYCHTQPFLYETLKQFYPELYRRMKARVRDGRWEIIGAPYVEPDCMVPSGESLIRQMLLGKRFFQKEFGVDVDTCWLPDVFGASWIMPQILVRSGIRYFVSNKMSTWNDTNRFPYSNFLWRGVDGTTVNACIPGTHFITWLAPDQIAENWERFPERNTTGESLNMYGFGDGGGGVTRAMLEAARRMRHFPGLPRTRLVKGKDYLDQAFADPGKLQVWDDELYLEMHRGTTTTKAILKKLNRRCELTAREAELFGTLAGRGPSPAMAAAWKQVLVNQFHDILPGSHVAPVAREAETTYREALRGFTKLRTDALGTLARDADTRSRPGKPVVVFNSLNWPHTGTVELPGARGTVRDADGNPVPAQRTASGSLVFLAKDVPPVGHAVYHLTGDSLRNASAPATGNTLENRFFRLQLDSNGEITSLFDKRSNREALADGQRANGIQLFEDKPGMYDAWDILPTYQDKQYRLPPAKSMTIEETGPVRTVVNVTRTFFSSRWEQRIILYADIPRIDFVTRVDWQERNKLLKVAFPVAVLARTATYDLSFGAIQRPTHANTSWDKAKYEVCGHQWADLSEGGFGVSLLNDSKYGWDIRGNVMRLTLLRGPIRPDPVSDLGEHEFTYSLFPHAGDWREGGTVQAAMGLNSPLIPVTTSRHSGRTPVRHSYADIGGQGVFLAALKPAEEGRDAVVRLVELFGGHTEATVRIPGMKTAHECDLIERRERVVRLARSGFTAAMRPFEIKTYQVTS